MAPDQQQREQIRIDNPPFIDRSSLEKDWNDGHSITVQFSRPVYTDEILRELDELCAKLDDRLTVRFYGHYSSSFDFRTLLLIPRVKSLYLDCLAEVSHTEELARLEHLYRLNLNVYELEDPEILRSDNLRSLGELGVHSEKKTINVEYLKEFRELHTLHAGGKVKNADAIGYVAELETLSLNLGGRIPLDFVNRLGRLKRLILLGGGRENLDEIGEIGIEYLRIDRVVGFSSFANLGNFKALRELRIEDQPRLTELHFDALLERLEDIMIVNCKTLSSFTGLENLPSLRKLVLFKMAVDFETFIQQRRPETLSFFTFATGKAKVDREIQRTLDELGYPLPD
ncbi:hypothetical protein [Cohnella candidum]|uniref:Leucine-rich repeat domain-containing protein n=1 Tax=Cohnella candidum TaxID=2674991 RepID=A0A3G3K2K1_9BACL|nr:hypothetical protein [Cohnella candidum]AYQ74754.1 hypothetical protein EAV92_20690 [Cohnella candidum]